MSTGSPLDDTYGIWLIALLFQCILYGMGLLQAYLYFFWYKRDSWWLRGSVLAIALLESLQAGTFFAATYRIFITGFGDFAKLNEVPWEASVGLESLYLSTCGVQLFFAWTIYQIKKEDRILRMLVVILALAAFGVGTAQIGLMSKLELYSDLGPISPVTITQAVLTFACDLVITASLLLRLQEGKQQAETTESQLKFLVVTAINRGALIVCMALLNIILFLARPGTFDFLSMVIISGNLYMNSMLAMLNSREHARVLAGFSTSIASEEFRAGPASWVEDPEVTPIPSLHIPSRNTTRTQRSRGHDAEPEEGFDEEFDLGQSQNITTWVGRAGGGRGQLRWTIDRLRLRQTWSMM